MNRPALTIAFIGAGNMTRSLVGGLCAAQADSAATPLALRAADPHEEGLRALHERFAVRPFHNDNAGAVAGADVVVFAVKPQVFADAARALRPALGDALILSIAAGVRVAAIDGWLGGERAIVRAMPNTPALVGRGAAGLYANPRVDAAQRQIAESILRAVGVALWVEEERLLDAVTALSGSGPAYFFLILEALQEIGVELGLPPATARALTLQTALGAASMASQSDEEVAALRSRVCSPGGTTERAIAALEEGGLRPLLRRAAFAARDRAVELGETPPCQT